MSSDKNPEVVGCDASIMRNVWEIRGREYDQKMHLEQERVEKSALPAINQDWANRATARQGHKAVTRKAKPAPDQTDDNIWKSKSSQSAPSPRRSTGSSSFGKPGIKRDAVSSAAKNKDTKAHDKILNKFIFITQTQPSSMVWGKSWKYNKSLPLDEGVDDVSQWGECWMFATHQPNTEECKPWPNGPNLIDPQTLLLWNKRNYKVVESQEVDSGPSTEEWQMSQKKYYKHRSASDNAGGVPNLGFFTSLVEAHRYNEVLCSSEWSDSWRSTKPASQQDHVTAPSDCPPTECITNKYDKNIEVSSTWEDCWKLLNHHGCNKAKPPEMHKYLDAEWAASWRAALVAFNNIKNSASSPEHSHSDSYDDRSDQEKSHLHKAILMPLKQKSRTLYLKLYDELQACSEWNESWQVTKNNSEQCEEIEKVLRASASTMGIAPDAQRMEKNEKTHFQSQEIVNPCYEQLKHSVIYQSKRELTRPLSFSVRKLETNLSVSEWGHSWKTLKHRMRMEGRRLRPHLSHPFKESEKEKDPMPSTPEWKNSWKFTCPPLRQEPELWQQNWYATPVTDRSRHQPHFMPVNLPKNGPTNEQSWGESWRFHGSGQISKSGQHRQQILHEGSGGHSSHPIINHSDAISASDWQDACMVSETQFHHDKPSFTQWRESWRWSALKADHWMEKLSMDNRLELQPQSRNISWQKDKAMISHTFDGQMFREHYPEKEWSKSWKAGTHLNFDRSSGLNGKIMNSPDQQQDTSANNKSKWLLSFRLAIPTSNVKQPWAESLPNYYHYTAMWSKGKNVTNKMKINTNFGNNPKTFRIWENSCCFLQSGIEKVKGKTKLNKPTDPMEIVPRKTKSRQQFYPNAEMDKQSQRKWAGCHSLAKTQPNTRKGPMSIMKIKLEDENKNRFFEEWAQSWKFWIDSGSLKKQEHIKSLVGWDLSWKFLLPRYQVMSERKTR